MQDNHNVNFGALLSEVRALWPTLISAFIFCLLFHQHEYCLQSQQVKNLRSNFTFSGLATSLVLGLLPSLWDSASDFAFAEEEETSLSLRSIGPSASASTYLTYFFISLPLHVTAATGLQRTLGMLANKCCRRCSQSADCQYRVCRGAVNQGVSKQLSDKNKLYGCNQADFMIF